MNLCIFAGYRGPASGVDHRRRPTRVRARAGGHPRLGPQVRPMVWPRFGETDNFAIFIVRTLTNARV